ncbi:NADP-dependent oxidoreductase [Antrihabitans sp. NCIMB 15449]|uniref:NADP-dependent oxidoreductase n=1 Tax=Antrihabitans spumae TaxID=3373370 RepID=A0ABW7JJL8_9NOCA
MRSGGGAQLTANREQWGLGWDVAGTVDAIGPGVEGFSVGDRVIGINDLLDVSLGTQAEYVVLDVGNVASAPKSVDSIAAATIPLNGLTALQALGPLALEAGDTLLVTGAAGGLGGYIVQLAAHRGIKVIAVAGSADEQTVRELGAAEFVARGSDVSASVRALIPGGVDAAVDPALLGPAALAAVRGGCRFAAVIGGFEPAPLRGTTVHLVQIRADQEQLTELSGLVDDGVLTLRVAETYPLEQLGNAHKRLAGGGIRGRLVVTV